MPKQFRVGDRVEVVVVDLLDKLRRGDEGRRGEVTDLETVHTHSASEQLVTVKFDDGGITVFFPDELRRLDAVDALAELDGS